MLRLINSSRSAFSNIMTRLLAGMTDLTQHGRRYNDSDWFHIMSEKIYQMKRLPLHGSGHVRAQKVSEVRYDDTRGMGCSSTCIVLILLGLVFLVFFVSYGTTVFVDPSTLVFIVLVCAVVICLILAAAKLSDSLREPE